MPALKVCRICLARDVKVYKYDRYDLKQYYEDIMPTNINEKDGLPHHFCYECAALLQKFHKFKEKCYSGLKVLKELLCKGPITNKSICKILESRKGKHLQSSIKIMTVTHRVKTCIIKSKEKAEVVKVEDRTVVDSDAVSVSDDDHFAEGYEEKEDIIQLPELIDVSKKIDDEEVMNISEVKVDFDDEKANSDDEKIAAAKSLLDFEQAFTKTINDKNLIHDNSALFVSDIHIPKDEEESIEKPPQVIVQKKKRNTKGSKRKNKDTKNKKTDIRFEKNSKKVKKTELDPKNWLKYTLSEEEAVEEFKARALHKQFSAAKYKCNDCLRGFSKEDMLNRHAKLRHCESLGPIECRFCRMRFKWKCMLTKHMRQHYTKYKCLRCDLVCPLETTALFHEEYHNGVKRKCEHCGDVFRHQSTYYTHLRTHRSEHVCTLCGASFVSAVGLGIHKKIKHVDNVPSMDSEAAEGTLSGEEYCKRCDIKFETKKAYEEHLIHSAMHVDGIERSSQMVLGAPKKRRKKRITQIPMDCRICGKHFEAQSACRRHHLTEHPRTSFTVTNERHICEICGISLAPGSVPSHLNTHTRAKIYSCGTCGRQFSSKTGLNTHQLTHTSEKPVPCTLCDKRFKQSSSMKLHYRTFHLKEPYPKRNRKKKSEEISKLDDSDDNMTLDRWR